jgi:tRNA pseudouridine38-40 synthase
MNDSGQSATQRARSPQTWKLTLAYDGTDFRGWQVQPGELTIQGELQNALGRITGETPLPQGSGRTDAGVHALAQVASFVLNAPIPAESLIRALNRTLPSSIRILAARTMPDSFHARHSALAKTYEYRILVNKLGNQDTCSPFITRYIYACPWILNFGALQQAASYLVGQHDFLSFAASDPDLSTRRNDDETDSPSRDSDLPVQSTVRKVYASAWEESSNEAGNLLVYRIRGNGFLHHMVRNLVGTMIEVGRGILKPDDIPRILAVRARSAAGPTAPARGLFLHSVEYE